MAAPVDPERCPLCGGPNGCALAGGAPSAAPCWCASVEVPRDLLERVPATARRAACLCARCAGATTEEP